MFYTCVPKILIIWSTVPETGKKPNRLKLVILGHFLRFYPPHPSLKTQNVKILKWWKDPGDIIILHMCSKTTIIWQNFLSFWAIFCPFDPLPLHPLPYQDKIRALFEIATAFGHTIILRLRSNTLASCMN